ncbi:hypothetical protein ANCCAN_24327 [Ancylostoma caninum]|uniref:Uncharacterized protein n=1 Tax=Ancylostoma caninum TaxID=29170 RepID=A0A368FFY4_ANCCA|nr:hypothetical protein ANCCAN_24327 [Ancylostoma caninum]
MPSVHTVLPRAFASLQSWEWPVLGTEVVLSAVLLYLYGKSNSCINLCLYAVFPHSFLLCPYRPCLLAIGSWLSCNRLPLFESHYST